MVSRIAAWFRSWFVLRKATGLQRMIGRAEVLLCKHKRDMDRCRTRLEKASRKLAVMHEDRTKDMQIEADELATLVKDVLGKVEAAEKAQQQYEQTIDGLRSELEVVKEVELKGLEAWSKKHLERIDAETAIEVRRRVGAAVPRELE